MLLYSRMISFALSDQGFSTPLQRAARTVHYAPYFRERTLYMSCRVVSSWTTSAFFILDSLLGSRVEGSISVVIVGRREKSEGDSGDPSIKICSQVPGSTPPGDHASVGSLFQFSGCHNPWEHSIIEFHTRRSNKACPTSNAINISALAALPSCFGSITITM